MSSAGGGGGERLQVVLGAFAVGAGWGPAVSELYKCRQDASALGAFILPTLGGSRDTAAVIHDHSHHSRSYQRAVFGLVCTSVALCIGAEQMAFAQKG